MNPEAVRKRKYRAQLRAEGKLPPIQKRKAKYGPGEHHLFHKYGINREQKNQLIKDQGGLCKLCGCDLLALDPRHVHVDHCHKTEAIRGILCVKCNAGLGMFNDDPARFQAAIEYLSLPPVMFGTDAVS